MKYMLDTNICIYIIKNKPVKVLKKFEKIDPKDVCIYSITASELWYGVYKSSSFEKNAIALEEFLSPLTILEYEENASKAYGKIRSKLEKKGKVIGSMDLLIAAHALSQNIILISNNVKEFKRIPGLNLENWA
ncbi:type II toxin-antitoxin system tRNA(fMet)-specific endonuclease VapC [Caminibacter pacificus]